MAWKAVRLLYRKGASEGIAGKVYARIRHGADYNRPSLMLSILGKHIRRTLMDDPDVAAVAHPVLVAILKGRPGLVYQHGELAAPAEAVVRGADYVLVPTDQAADVFVKGGYGADHVMVTGLCIENALVKRAEDHFEQRLRRINGLQPLTGAFFSSGAEPKAHVAKLVAVATQAVLSGGRAIIVARQFGRLARTATLAFDRLNIPFTRITSADPIPTQFPAVLLVEYSSRREMDLFTAKLFDSFDYFVAPSHERTNWALGLGIPMFVVGPTFGPFSPLNLQIMIQAGVANILDSRHLSHFGRRLKDLRQCGILSEMAQNGWNRYDINGFDRAADFLLNYCS